MRLRGKLIMNNITENTEELSITDNEFTYDGYQVVRREFFSHLYDPSICFNMDKIYVNSAALKRLPKVEFMQILINPETHKLVLRPCDENAKDSFAWCRINKYGKRLAKQVTCRIFFAKIFELMNWNPEYRYKLLGKLIKSGNESLFIFDLDATEVYQRTILDDGKPKTSRIPVFPAEWKNQFGLSVEEHSKQLGINIFEGYVVFGIKEKSNNDKKQIDA